MSLPEYCSVGSVPASFVCVYHFPSDTRRRFFIGDKYQKNVMLFRFLLHQCGMSMEDASIAIHWTDNAKVGDSISFSHVSLTGMPYPRKSDNAPGGVKARASGSV